MFAQNQPTQMPRLAHYWEAIVRKSRENAVNVAHFVDLTQGDDRLGHDLHHRVVVKQTQGLKGALQEGQLLQVDEHVVDRVVEGVASVARRSEGEHERQEVLGVA